MGKFIRIFLLAFFILTVSAAPGLAAGKSDPPSWGGGEGGGKGHKGVPEIDPSLAPSALALLSGGLLILKSKSGKKDK
jgi:hypothetical protein